MENYKEPDTDQYTVNINKQLFAILLGFASILLLVACCVGKSEKKKNSKEISEYVNFMTEYNRTRITRGSVAKKINKMEVVDFGLGVQSTEMDVDEEEEEKRMRHMFFGGSFDGDESMDNTNQNFFPF
jgi:hypothetical protein